MVQNFYKTSTYIVIQQLLEILMPQIHNGAIFTHNYDRSIVEDFAASLPLQLIQPTNKNKSTFTHHSGITQRHIPSPSGDDHKIIILDRQQQSNNSHLNRMCWNFKKANWSKFKQELET
jgi:hypothetical protein